MFLNYGTPTSVLVGSQNLKPKTYAPYLLYWVFFANIVNLS